MFWLDGEMFFKIKQLGGNRLQVHCRIGSSENQQRSVTTVHCRIGSSENSMQMDRAPSWFTAA